MIRIAFSTSNSSFVSNPYGQGAVLVSGLAWGSGKYNMLSGTLIINNTSRSNITLYYWTQGFDVYDSGTSAVTITNFGKSLWGENSIIAYPMN